MTQARRRFDAWINNPLLDENSRQELLEISADEAELEDRFYQELQFGTAGLRGILAAGSNRMNDYTVARAAEGFAQHFLAQGEAFCRKGLVISYDSRNYSREFAELTARVFVGHGIAVRLSDELRPVPLISFAIRHFGCSGGVMITASHNPREYNGFKAYGGDGGQLPPDAAAVVAAAMEKIDDPQALLATVPSREEAEKRAEWQWMGKDLDDAYMAMLKKLSISGESVKRHKDLAIVYTPLHGSGNKPVRRILREIGFENVQVVPAQELPDGNFPTCPYPNPEARAALELGIRLAEERNADLLIATDPDADRTGVAVRTRDGDFVVLSGNQIGLLLMEYILDAKAGSGRLAENSFCVSTIVSSRLSQRICDHYGVKLYKVLTGFKFIAEKILEHDEEGDGHFQFGYEESFGYLAGLDVRDKDAVVSSMLMAEMAAESADRGETLYERLQRIYQVYGYGAEETISLVRAGKVGLDRIAAAMKAVRADKLGFFEGLPIRAVEDYQELQRLELSSGALTELDFSRSNVLVFELDDLDWFAIRPSGTEPKLKIYFGCYRADRAEAERALAELRGRVADKVEEALGN